MGCGVDVSKVPLSDDALWPVSITVSNLVIIETVNETVPRRLHVDFSESRQCVLDVLDDLSMEFCQALYLMNSDPAVPTTATPTRHT